MKISKTVIAMPVLGFATLGPLAVAGATSAPSAHAAQVRTVRAPESFRACVAWRESANGQMSSNVYGFLPSTWASLGLQGSPYTASRAQQDAAFQMLYARDGTAPWSPYDGC